MEEAAREVHFETRRHASMRCVSGDQPPQKLKGEDGEGLLSYLSLRGITRFKEKWGQQQRVGRLLSLYVSPRADYLAVACGNRVTILHKDNDYQEPVGSFTCGGIVKFTCGAWSESHELLGVVDDNDTIHLVKPNGEEMTRILKKNLPASAPIVGLIVQDDASVKHSNLYIFTVIVSDGSLHDIEISKDPCTSIFSRQALSNALMLREFPLKIVCWDYQPQLSLFVFISSAGDNQSALVGNNGSSIVSVWRRRDTQMELITFAEYEGSYTPRKGCSILSYGKVLFSPSGKSVASLDLNSCLFTFQLNEDKSSLFRSFCSFIKGIDASKRSPGVIHDVADFTWWSNDILLLAKTNGSITMIDCYNYESVSKTDLVCSMPLLERPQHSKGLAFLLENTLSGVHRGSFEVGNLSKLISENIDISKLEWCLLSFTNISAAQVYDKLIARHQYEAAIEFAENHGLDKDKVLKSQWISSEKGVQHVINVLSDIKDTVYILSECVTTVGPTEAAMRSLLSLGLQLTDSYIFSELENEKDDQIWDFRTKRLKLLQFRDRLETFIGINMGRYSAKEYSRFRGLPISKAAVGVAEFGKIEALNLLLKHHPFSLLPSILEVLDAIPETLAVESYGHLLPAVSAPSAAVLRHEDWVESETMVTYIRQLQQSHELDIQLLTEPILMKLMPLRWPSISELTSWYKKRCIAIDSLSGQLDECVSLIDMAVRKGISALQPFLEDISYFCEFVYSAEYKDAANFLVGLSHWAELPDYEKFKMIMMGVERGEVITRLYKMAVPFMQKKFQESNQDVSFLVRWLIETAVQKLDTCLIIIDQGCRDVASAVLFKDEVELIDCSLRCVYTCSDTSQWNTMANILLKLSDMKCIEPEDLMKRLKSAEDHVEAGRLLAYYQVPRPLNFFLDVQKDEKSVKQIIRLLISKFTRWQPPRTDHDWASMWRDLQSLQEKTFSFLDSEYLLTEFCRGLLKAGRFHLARNCLKGINSVALTADKAESLVIQASREYLYSAPTLASPEIWKAKECLSIFPNNRNVRVDADIIDALIDKLPNFGVNLLPMEFRQIKDRMEIVKLAITTQSGAYMNVEELIEIARLLGLSSQDEISRVQEAIAREAAFAGDMQLAFDLCLVLAKKGHGSVWDLCVALARSKSIESGNSKSQKFLLGFALCHCDDESIGELLQEWRDLDIQENCETFISVTGEDSVEINELNTSDVEDLSKITDHSLGEQELTETAIKSLSLVAQEPSSETECDWDSLINKNGKVRYFVLSSLPWLLKLSEAEFGKRLISDSAFSIYSFSIRTRALMTILSWLAWNSFTPRDDLIASLAKSTMELPFSDGDDIHACCIFLNLLGAFYGAEIIEKQLSDVEDYHEFSNLMNVGMLYGLLNSYSGDCKSPAEKRDLLMNLFQRNHNALTSELTEGNETRSSFWKEWKTKLERLKTIADRSRKLQDLIPGAEATRFLSGDAEYIQSVIFSFIDVVKVEKKKILYDALMLAQNYGLDHRKVLLHYLKSILASEAWTVGDIVAEVSGFEEDIVSSAGEAVESLSYVYIFIDGRDKERLAFIYGLLAECYMRIENLAGSPVPNDQQLLQASTVQLPLFCKTVGEECSKVSFIKSLDFKNIAGLNDLNFDCLKTEVYSHIDENTVEALARMVQNFTNMYADAVPENLLSWKSVYAQYLLSLLVTLEGKAEGDTILQKTADVCSFIDEIELVYDIYKKYMGVLEYPDSSHIGQQIFRMILILNQSLKNIDSESISKECPVKLIHILLRLMNRWELLMSENIFMERFYPGCLPACLKAFLDLLVKDTVSPSQGWYTPVNYMLYGLKSNDAIEAYNFCIAMVFGGCKYEAIGHVVNEILTELSVQDLPNLYLKILQNILHEIACESLGFNSLLLLLSSLSRQDGNLEDLKRTRNAIWGRMSLFCDDVQLPSHLRVRTLELMQIISGRKKDFDGVSSNIQASALLWEGWDDFEERIENLENKSDEPPARDVSCRFVALKSSQLVSSISPTLEITTDDLVSVDSAASCFRKMADMATCDLHVRSLLDVLIEWETLFVTGKSPIDSIDKPDTSNAPRSDDWDEGWESLQDENTKEETVETREPSVHPLHLCWLIIMEKLLSLSNHEWMLKLLDQNSDKNSDTILEEDNARYLIQAAIELDCFLALKIALLLPYRTLHLQCLDSMEKKLNEGGISDDVSQDIMLFLLVLSSGILSAVTTEPSYGNTFSYLNFMAGNLLRRFKEAQKVSARQPKVEEGKGDQDSLFVTVLFPCFIAEIVKADQHILASFLVTRFMHTNPSLSLMSTSDANLRKYLSSALRQAKVNESQDAIAGSFEPLQNTVSGLIGKLEKLIESTLALLPTEFR